MMRRSAARIVPATITAGVLATCVAFAQLIPPAKSPPTEAQQKKAMASLSAPWPDADTLRQRRVTSENRRLFQPADPLAFTLLADFKAVGRDRDPNSTKS